MPQPRVSNHRFPQPGVPGKCRWFSACRNEARCQEKWQEILFWGGPSERALLCNAHVVKLASLRSHERHGAMEQLGWSGSMRCDVWADRRGHHRPAIRPQRHRISCMCADQVYRFMCALQVCTLLSLLVVLSWWSSMPPALVTFESIARSRSAGLARR